MSKDTMGDEEFFAESLLMCIDEYIQDAIYRNEHLEIPNS